MIMKIILTKHLLNFQLQVMEFKIILKIKSKILIQKFKIFYQKNQLLLFVKTMVNLNKNQEII